MHTFLKLAVHVFSAIWRKYFNITCANPPNLRGQAMAQLPLDAVVCNVTEKCPEECFCQDQPENGYVLVDCRKKSLRALPDDLPVGSLKILLEGNSIQSLDARPYLNRTMYIDLSRNGLKHVSPGAIAMLPKNIKLINLNFNALRHLPEIIQNIHFSKLTFQKNPLVCDCTSAWMSQWLKQQDHEDASQIACSDGGSRNTRIVVEADDVFAQCHGNPSLKVLSIVLGVVGVLFLVIVVLLMLFRHEAALLFHMLPKRVAKPPPVELEFDMFVSMEEECAHDLSWTVHTLLPELERKRNMKLYFPPRDMDPGTVTVDEVITTLKKCRTALVLLSERYIRNPNKMYEFNESFNIMVKQGRGRVIMVKNGNVKKCQNGFVNAFLRLKKVNDINDPEIFDKVERIVSTQKQA